MAEKVPAAQKQTEVSFRPYADCLSKGSSGSACGWQHPVSINTLDRAKEHARSFNHKVRIVRETVAVYGRNDYDHANDIEGLD